MIVIRLVFTFWWHSRLERQEKNSKIHNVDSKNRNREIEKDSWKPRKGGGEKEIQKNNYSALKGKKSVIAR